MSTEYSCGAPGVVTMKVREMTIDGSIYTTDYEARATSVNVHPAPDAYVHGRTVQVVPAHLMVDLDRDNRPRTIEILSEELTVYDLMKVLRHCVWSDEPFEESA